jgi:5-methylcytosine-specific restriction enzyme subunit McrC
MSSAIPIRNIYFLLCYAWNRLQEGGLVDVSADSSTTLADLFARVLLTGTRHLLRRGLEQGYALQSAEITGIRGRPDLLQTARRFLVQHGRAACDYDELTLQTLPNQILKATLRLLAGVPEIHSTLRQELRMVHRSLGTIDDLPLSAQAFRRVQLYGNNRHYKFLLHVCELVYRSWLVDEATGAYRFRDFLRDEHLMARVFEDFVFHFYRIECPAFTVRKEMITWQASSASDPDLTFLPRMHTDISVRNAHQTIIIDAKYYQETLQHYYDSASIHSAHLYQLFAYVKNFEYRGGTDATAEGILLYPTVQHTLRLSYEMHGHTIRICTLDLAQDWQAIRRDLLRLVSEAVPVGP